MTITRRMLILDVRGPCARIRWEVVGSSQWADFSACLARSIQQSGSDSTAVFGSLSGTYKWLGGVLAPNGKIYGIPLSSTTVLKIDPDTVAVFPDALQLSAYFNKF